MGEFGQDFEAFRVVFIVAIADPWVPWARGKVGLGVVTLGACFRSGGAPRGRLEACLNYVSVSMIGYPFQR